MVQALIAGGMTQKAIADRIGCTQPTISEIASGKVGKARPSYKIVSGLETLMRELPSPDSIETTSAPAPA